MNLKTILDFLLAFNALAIQAAPNNWQNQYMADEFGDADYSKPVYQLIVDPIGGYGASVEFNGNDRIIIKHHSGDREEIPYEMLDDGNFRITNPTNIKRFVDILQSGDIEMAIAGDKETRYYNFSINDEFKNIRKALRFLRDVPDVESIYGTIN